MTRIRRLLYVCIFLFALGLLGVVIANVWVIGATKRHIYHSISDLPATKVALVLGTSKRTRSGSANRFFAERMEMAAQLYHQGKVAHILVSGDNRTLSYNEPIDMLRALEALDIPDSVVSLDYAGFRTFDSIVRAKKVFGQDRLVIVTQEFHCFRALFIAQRMQIEALAIAADEGSFVGNYLTFREVMARTVAVLDLYLFNRKPKFLGEKVPLSIHAHQSPILPFD